MESAGSSVCGDASIIQRGILLAVLQLISGGVPETQYPIRDERVVLGRHPNCQIVLPNAAVSRHHAQILESHGTYYIEDLRSRNKTYVNGEETRGRRELHDGDNIRLCDVVLQFLQFPSDVNHQPPDGAEQTPLSEDSAEISDLSALDEGESRVYLVSTETVEQGSDLERSTSIRLRADDVSHHSTIDPNVKLRAIVEITQALSRELKVDRVLPKLLVTLFNIFPQAEQGFVLLKDFDTHKLKVKASRTRGDSPADNVAVSMTVVRHVLQSGEAILSADVSDDSRFKASTALSKMQIRSMMCVPMRSQEGDGIGVIQIVTRDEVRAFTEEDLDLLVSLASQAAMAVENARLHEEDVKRRELERDLNFATQVQLGFLPKSRPDVPGYAFADYYEAAQSVGGDYFDYIMLPDGRVALAIGDVAGKGMPAALLMARLYSSTRFQLLTRPSIEEAVTGLNEEISSSGLGHRFITFAVMVLDPSTNELTVVNAGHLTPLLRRASGRVVQFGKKSSGLPLGIVPDLVYASEAVTLEPCDAVIAYTDGVTEEMNAVREIYGQTRLIELIERETGTIAGLIESIVNDVEKYGDRETPRDDTCIIGLARADS